MGARDRLGLYMYITHAHLERAGTRWAIIISCPRPESRYEGAIHEAGGGDCRRDSSAERLIYTEAAPFSKRGCVTLFSPLSSARALTASARFFYLLAGRRFD